MGYVDTTGYLLGQQEAAMAASNTPEHKSSLDQDSFLTILVAQLTHQDPLSPMEDTDMTSQLAQFSSLEQLTNINTNIQALGSSMEHADLLNSVSFIGKDVKADGYNISIDDGDVSTIYYGFGEPVTGIMMSIYDKDGAIIRSVELGSKEAGTYQYTWDGKDDDGNPQPDGTYGVGILGEDINGDAVMVQTEISGTVDAVVNEGGTRYLRLKDGRFLNYLNVTEIVDSGAEDIVDAEESEEEEVQ
jgi:flagellar basal-body rod modification protein FlgD